MTELSLWRAAARQEIHSVAFRFRDELDTPYYGSRAGSWVGEAREAADGVIDSAGGESWAEFCTQVIAGLGDQAERWRGSEFSDPDGFGGTALSRFSRALDAVKDDDFATACAKMEAAAKDRNAKPIPSHDICPLPPEYFLPLPPPPPLLTRLAAWWRGRKE